MARYRGSTPPPQDEPVRESAPESAPPMKPISDTEKMVRFVETVYPNAHTIRVVQTGKTQFVVEVDDVPKKFELAQVFGTKQ